MSMFDSVDQLHPYWDSGTWPDIQYSTVVMSRHPQPRSAAEKQPLASIVGAPHCHMKFVVSNHSFNQILPINHIGEVFMADLRSAEASRFAIHPQSGERLYRTGDLSKMLPDGSVLPVGHIDREVKVRGYQIELDDVERTICDLIPEVMAVSVQPDESPPSLSNNFFDIGSNSRSMLVSALASQLKTAFPSAKLRITDLFLHVIILAQAELVSDKRGSVSNSPQSQSLSPALPLAPQPGTSDEDVPGAILTIWKAFLSAQDLNPSSNFFDAGGHSLAVTLLLERIRAKWPWADIEIIDLFPHATVKSQAALVARYLPTKIYHSPKSASEKPLSLAQHSPMTPSSRSSEIAVVGMAGCFPGASNPDELFRIFLEKREALTTFPERDPESLPFKDAIYIPKCVVIPAGDEASSQHVGACQSWAVYQSPFLRVAIGSDAATKKAGCTVPGPRGQADVIMRAWKDSGISPSKVVYAEIEHHSVGEGTREYTSSYVLWAGDDKVAWNHVGEIGLSPAPWPGHADTAWAVVLIRREIHVPGCIFELDVPRGGGQAVCPGQ
ncbi:uncharacterized protein LACBIDRAFT_333039 [Laccaria bicolor S238N-H82]|uniref:Predicted protein n=1 Tax=Laccaria bicolor (strain S238N-H82 / ATCC MYA-4686) TaxID=486041 RepID=B0DUM8_LACBS|nr:uncharacterized protein LACBIDRAFT_333039 [Laccaria bicolor S238N-H82]EDR01566.1 predicted protein [Laccaria bicolor S238N-H82]|eukprot:XP_001887642.1 predicted protein [Laccaria bicolor S238N-H82]